MSKILKKIAKKYKWLRFLNRKVTKLSVLGASFVGLCISSGASFAKYRDENYGNGNEGIATMGGASLKYDYETNQISSYLDPLKDKGYYIFMSTFRVELSASETSRSLSLHLKMSLSTNDIYNSYSPTTHNSFTLPNNVSNKDLPSFIYKNINGVNSSYKVSSVLPVPNSTIDNKGTSNTADDVTVDINQTTDTNRAKWDEFYNNNEKIESISSNTVYYAYSLSANNYIWKTYNYNTDSNNITTILDGFILNNRMLDGTELPISTDSITIYFRLIYFSEFFIDTSGLLATESSKILYKIELNQT